ncbi:MAG: F-type H+-transporting ATPase subunit b [Polaribacter sp.]|jgi:F-type H+-transporting ATPase subunit b
MEMIFLSSAFNPIKPDIGLIFWTTIIFFIFWIMMYKFAFGPIRDALTKRESDIQEALDAAAKAKEDMSNLKSENEKILADARAERSMIMKEAKEARDSMVAEAKEKASAEGKRIVEEARQEIENQKTAAMLEIKNQAGNMALLIAEKIIKKQLVGDAEQENFANGLVKDMKLN